MRTHSSFELWHYFVIRHSSFVILPPMKRNLSDYVVAISVILCSLVLLGALTFALSGYRLKKSKRTLQINYEDVTGIKVNSEVRYAGAPAGRVIAMRHL